MGTPPAAGNLRLSCDRIELDVANRELRIDGEATPVERRAFDLIAYLMANSGRVVDKDELLDEVWAGRPVSESTVAQAVSRARKTLGGDGPEAYIANVYGVGYRFAQAVQEVAPATASAPAPVTASADRNGWLLWAVACTALIAAGLAVWRPWESARQAEPIRIAVLPVRNDTGDPELDWVRLGVLPMMVETLNERGVPSVRPGTVLATLRRYPDAEEAVEQARILQLSTGADSVLAPRLSRDATGLRLDVSEVGEQDGGQNRQLGMTLYGEDIPMLAVASAVTLSERLARWQGAQRAQSSLVTEDPFVNEAFARGLDARLRGRFEQAANYFDTALAAAPDLLEAKYHLSLVTRRMGDYEYTDQLNRELLASAQASGNQNMLAAVQSVSGTLAWRRGDREAALSWYEQALANYQAMNNLDYIASVTGNLGILAATGSDYQTAEARFLATLGHYEQTGDQFNEATVLKNLGHLYNDQGRYGDAESYLLRSLSLRQTLELPLQVAQTMSTLADIKMARGRWDEAAAYQERVREAAQKYENPRLEAQASADLAAALLRLGRLSEARGLAARARGIAAELGNPSTEAFALLQQGRVELAGADPAEAAARFTEAAEIYARIEEPLGQANSQVALAEALVELGDTEQAANRLEDAQGQIDALALDTLRVSLLSAQAALAARSGDSAAAISGLSDAYQLAQNQEATVEVLAAGGRLGLLLLEQASPDNRLPTLAQQLGTAPQASVEALAFLSRYYQRKDPVRALDFAMQRRRLLGEGWRAADEQALRSLQGQVPP
ncbi:MAG: tetratricopeptide repeat protein [Pseudomonadota bacterium]